MPTYRMLLAYDGAGFHGYAAQPELRTVQGELEDALSKATRETVSTSVAGRTDAGVHALGQVVSFRTESPIEVNDVIRRINSILGPELAVLEIDEAPDGFDARFSAVSRTYEYGILQRSVHDPFSRFTTWHHPDPLDLEAMRKASQTLLGEHDFASFGRVPEGKASVRRIDAIDIEDEGELIVIRITANSFIQQMVRSIVGTLVKVGEGSITADDVGEILEARDRSAAGTVAPPHGLFLASVSYPAELT